MSELVPATSPPAPPLVPPPSLLAPLTDPAGGPAFTRLRSFAAQPPLRRMVPWFAGVSLLGLAGLTWAAMSPAPQRVLYSQLDDGERASVVDALDKAAIPYVIDNQTGALTVNEDDLYKARMLVAADGAIAQPESGSDMLANMPMGASRTLEDERLRAARERELTLSIMEIDGVESVRVHLAEGEKSVFVRDSLPPTASVMVRLARGRQLSESQVTAIVNLVAGSVPGLSIDAVQVVDQHGRLLSDKTGNGSDRLELQARLEEKMRGQVSALLTPMLGDGNFTSEIQVELDMDEVTSARESYDKDGVVRSETQAQSSTTGTSPAVGVPGALSNTPPPQPTAQAAPPQGTPPATGTPAPTNGETSSTRTFELGREVAVANSQPGKLKRISVAVAISGAAMKNAKPDDIAQLKQLVSAAVGADPQRGDQVAVIVRSFEPVSGEPLPFWETPWFATILRNAVALIAVLLVLMLGVRPLIRALKGEPAPPPPAELPPPSEGEDEAGPLTFAEDVTDPETGEIDPEALNRQVGFARQLVAEKPDAAVFALRQMLATPEPGAA